MSRLEALPAASVWSADSIVPIAFKRLLGVMASKAHGCQYCMAHAAGGALRLGIDPDKFDAIWSYQTSPLYSPTERVTLDFALGAAASPQR
jgi:alkylhydroperoxidase family enzyme